MRYQLAILATAGAAAVAVPLAAAHNAPVVCSTDGHLTVTPDTLRLHPVVSFDATARTVTVTWDDGFVVTNPIPEGCAVPAPTPTPGEQGPVGPPGPAGPAGPAGTPAPVPTPKPVNCARLRSQGAGTKWLKLHGCVLTPASYRCPRYLLPSKGWQTIIHRRHGVWCPVVPSRKPVTPAVLA